MFAKSKLRQIIQATDSHYAATSLAAQLSTHWFNVPVLQFTTADCMGKHKRKHLPLFDCSHKCHVVNWEIIHLFYSPRWRAENQCTWNYFLVTSYPRTTNSRATNKQKTPPPKLVIHYPAAPLQEGEKYRFLLISSEIFPIRPRIKE